jgi:S-methylmethionine-dependent homocysteine/selenocysteine methylase
VGATVDVLSARTDLGPDRYAEFAQGWVDAGAKLIGGCCEVGPAHIATLAARFK